MWITEISGSKYWQERVTDPLTGKSRIVSCKIQKDTPAGRKAARQKLEARLLCKKPQPKSKLKLSQVMDMYIESMQLDVQHGDLRESTCLRNTNSMHTALRIIGDVYMDKLTAGYINSKMIYSGKDNTGKNELMKRFKTFLRWAKSHDLLPDRNIIDDIERYKEPSEREKIKDKYLEAEEVEKLISGMQCRRWALLTQFLVLSGLRIGEAIALDKSDVDSRYIHVTKTYNPVIREVGPTKTDGSTRDVFIQKELADCIREIRKEMLEEKLIFAYDPTPYFMTGLDGNRISYDAYRKYLRESCKEILGRDGVTPHITRHTHTSLLAAAGIPLDTISRRLGHSSSAITRRIYLHVTKTMKIKDNKQIEDITLLDRFA